MASSNKCNILTDTWKSIWGEAAFRVDTGSLEAMQLAEGMHHLTNCPLFRPYWFPPTLSVEESVLLIDALLATSEPSKTIVEGRHPPSRGPTKEEQEAYTVWD